MNPPSLGNSNGSLSHSRGGTPNLKTGGMQNARAQQNHTPNQQMMHMGSGNSDSLTTPIVSMPTPSFPGMQPSFQSGLPSNYPNYNDMDTGQMSSYGSSNSFNSNHSSQALSQHQQVSMQRYEKV